MPVRHGITRNRRLYSVCSGRIRPSTGGSNKPCSYRIVERVGIDQRSWAFPAFGSMPAMQCDIAVLGEELALHSLINHNYPAFPA